MKQPELGIFISQQRAAQGLTQQELADRCRVNIRTIQRIESGEVSPRKYTLNLLTKILHMENHHQGNRLQNEQALPLNLKINVLGGIVYAINGLAVVYDLITHTFSPLLHTSVMLIHTASCLFFFGGFYHIGRRSGNRLLAIPALLMLLLLSSLNGLDLIKNIYFSIGQMLVFILMCTNMVVLGAGLLKESFEKRYESGMIYLAAGILTILISILYISLNTTIIYAGLIVSIPGNLLLLYILLIEGGYRGKKYDQLVVAPE